MSATGNQSGDQTLEDGSHHVIRRYRAVAEQLPGPDTTWTAADIGVDARTIKIFRHKGLVNTVGRRRNARNNIALVYQTSRAAYEYIQSLDTPATPCGHTGVHCLEAGERYTCAYDDCDEEFGAETARAEVTR